MKLSAFSHDLKQKISLIKANLWFKLQQDLAYSGNNWAGLASTTVYTLTMLLFLNFIFSNTKLIAGYTYNEMLLFFLVAQICYYTGWVFSFTNSYELVNSVNQGSLDMVLVKPVSSLLFLYTRHVSLWQWVREGVPPSLFIVFSINWSSLSLRPTNLFLAGLILILGFWITHVFAFLSALPVFWLGESTSILDLTLHLFSGGGAEIPLEGFSTRLRTVFSTVIPILIPTAFTTSALLGKSNPYSLLFLTVIIAAIATYLRQKLWHVAIKNYTSASS